MEENTGLRRKTMLMNHDSARWMVTLPLIAGILLCGCLARPLVVQPDSPEHRLQSEIVLRQVAAVAQTGDWLVTRGYHASDNLVANATGVPLSHVGVFDAGSKTVIEAEGQGVHSSTLEEFVARSHRVIVIRPRWRNDENGRQAWAVARKLVGKDYDYLGTVGFDYPDKYYCSELAVVIYKPWYSGREKFPKVIKPGELYLYGRVLYDSLPRDEI